LEIDNIHSVQVSQNALPVSTVPELFTIANSQGTRLIVSNCGAAVVSLFVKNKEGVLVDVVLGYADPATYLSDEFYMGTVVGRYANRIAGDTVNISGYDYKLSTKQGGYHQHGGTIGFNKKCFKGDVFQNAGTSGIIFSYTSPHLEEGFPGQMALDVIYTLDEDNSWKVEYKAVSTQDTLINLTQHSYFNLSGHAGTTINNHQLTINSTQFLPVNEMQVPTGEFKDVQETPFDFRTFKPIGKDIDCHDHQLLLSGGYDHSFILHENPAGLLNKAAIAIDQSSGIMMEVYTTEPAVHFYSGNFLNDIMGKEGIVYNRRSGFCLETQHFPDAPNKPHFPSTILRKGEEFNSQTVFKFSVVNP
jgi:aldose 1-epimerase